MGGRPVGIYKHNRGVALVRAGLECMNFGFQVRHPNKWLPEGLAYKNRDARRTFQGLKRRCYWLPSLITAAFEVPFRALSRNKYGVRYLIIKLFIANKNNQKHPRLFCMGVSPPPSGLGHAVSSPILQCSCLP